MLVAVVAGAALVVRGLTTPAGAVLPLRGLPRLVGEVDVLGSALVVVALGSLVGAFAAADPATQVVAHGPVLLPLALAVAVAFVLHERRCTSGTARAALHERRAADPVLPLRTLRPRGAWGALLVNLFSGAALSPRWSTSRSSTAAPPRPVTSSGRPSCCCGCWSPCRSGRSPAGG